MRIDLETLLANSMFANHVQIFATTNYLKEVGIMGHNLKFYTSNQNWFASSHKLIANLLLFLITRDLLLVTFVKKSERQTKLTIKRATRDELCHLKSMLSTKS
jgi:hypothetical protein